VWSKNSVRGHLAGVAELKHRKILGEAIRNYRKKAGLTQEQLAEKADLHHNFIGGVERGTMEISVTSLLRIAKALRIKLGDLIDQL